MEQAKWEFWIDRGGMFIDVVGRSPAGLLHGRKLLSGDVATYPDVAVQGIRDILGLHAGDPVPSYAIACVKIGTTVAPSTLFESRGGPTLLVVTRGLRDAPRIACQSLTDMLANVFILPERTYDRVIEVDERTGADGTVERARDLAALRSQLEAARTEGFGAIAIVFSDARKKAVDERVVAALARDLGFSRISASHEESPLAKLVARGDTLLANADMPPALRRCVERVAELLGIRPSTSGKPGLQVVASYGGLGRRELGSGEAAGFRRPKIGLP